MRDGESEVQGLRQEMRVGTVPLNWKIVTMIGGKTYHHISAFLGGEAQLVVKDAGLPFLVTTTYIPLKPD